jgi:hypothetical protein
MLEEIRNIKSEKGDLRKFGIVIGTFFLILAGYFFWKENGVFQILFIVGVILFVISTTIPVTLIPVYWPWMVFASILGWVMTRVILSFLFYLVFTPIGLILRLVGKQFIEIKINQSQRSYWKVKASESFKKENYDRQF